MIATIFGIDDDNKLCTQKKDGWFHNCTEPVVNLKLAYCKQFVFDQEVARYSRTKVVTQFW